MTQPHLCQAIATTGECISSSNLFKNSLEGHWCSLWLPFCNGVFFSRLLPSFCNLLWVRERQCTGYGWEKKMSIIHAQFCCFFQLDFLMGSEFSCHFFFNQFITFDANGCSPVARFKPGRFPLWLIWQCGLTKHKQLMVGKKSAPG